MQQARDLFAAESAQVEWFASRKYDGVRAIWDGKQLTTKQGNRIFAPQSFLRQLPDFPVDGELWLATKQFHRVNKMVLASLNNQVGYPNLWSKVQYLVFDVPKTDGNLLQRLHRLQLFLKQTQPKQLKIIAQHRIGSYRQLQSFYQSVLELGGEGIILRDAGRKHQVGRLNNVFKIKPKLEAECTVTGYVPGKGRLLNRVGALRCELLPSQKPRLFPKLAIESATEIRLGSGLSDQQRLQPPKIGSVVTFQYQGHTRTGLPRFAVFLRERFSAMQADNLQIQ
ncbi:DNA ligase [Thiomicrorhabdus marina]|uniref:DNA ligase n=1 Tax=Thiomicrorhabdus marina TaxID=2818442 RepID=UPI001AAD516B|nr:DNA ligase [Thiomicrorhabdus marina]